MVRRTAFTFCVSVLILSASVCPLRAAGVDLIDASTPWRAYLVQGPNLLRDKGALKVALPRVKPEPFDAATAEPARLGFSSLPPTDWSKADFDDRYWPRYLMSDLGDFIGDYGVPVGGGSGGTALLCLRTSFGVSDPAAASGLTVTVTCLGGAVVYVNGREAGRAFLPAGPLHPLTVADDYPVEAYTAEDGTTPLPVVPVFQQIDAKWADRYAKRVRTGTIEIPAQRLVKGRNVLAIELHRAAVAGPLPTGRNVMWSHVGLHKVSLTGAAAGTISYAEAARGTRVWSANAEDVVADSPAEKSMIRRSTFKTMLWTRGEPVRGIAMGNPFDPILPIRMAAPRQGVASGQTVLSDPAGLKAIKAGISPLKNASGATIPASAVGIRYGVQSPPIHFCDALIPTPPDGARTVPVWVVVEPPKNQSPGWYGGSLSLSANGNSFTVPVQVLVTGATLPAPRDLSPIIDVIHSPETIAAHYKVKPWSDEHFRLIEPSLALMGQLGNDVLQVPVIVRNQFNWKLPLIRFVKEGDTLRPDFTILNRYLDLYAKHCAPPKAVVLYIWDPGTAERVANAYEGRQIDSRDNKPREPSMVQLVDGVTEANAPQIGGPGSEAFYKALVGGVKEIVEKRSWPVSCVMLGLGGDVRPSKEAAELMRQWAPYARWSLLSHFSGDPGSGFYKGPDKQALGEGKLIAVGGLEVGLKQHPWTGPWNGFTAAQFEKFLATPMEYLDLGTARWIQQDYSPPILFKTLPMLWARLGRVGLDFWGQGRGGPTNSSYFTQLNRISAPGPEGAVPTVRFQMMRQGMQDAELRLSIIAAYTKLPEAQRKPYRDLVDGAVHRIAFGSSAPLSLMELILDWPGYDARVQQTAAELSGVASPARWDQPPN